MGEFRHDAVDRIILFVGQEPGGGERGVDDESHGLPAAFVAPGHELLRPRRGPTRPRSLDLLD